MVARFHRNMQVIYRRLVQVDILVGLYFYDLHYLDKINIDICFIQVKQKWTLLESNL